MAALRSTATIALAAPETVLRMLCEHLVEHATVMRYGLSAHVETAYGRALLDAGDGSLTLAAEAADTTSLAFVKMGLADLVLDAAVGETPVIRWSGDGGAGRQPPYFRQMRVVATSDLTPHMRRLTLAGDDIGRFATGGLHVRLLFPAKGRTPVWPVTGEDGRPVWPKGEDALALRVYTIRKIDVPRGEVVVDMVLHPGSASPGSHFAETARPGDVVGMVGPGGGGLGKASSFLLVGDATALPAIARLLEELPRTARAEVIVEVEDAADRQELISSAAVGVRWLHRSETRQRLPDAVAEVDWDALGPDVFVWAGCEFSDFKAIRHLVRKQRKLSRSAHLVVAYWRRGFAGDAARSA